MVGTLVRTRPERIAALLLAVPGVFAPFLPFTFGISPLDGLTLEFALPLIAAPAFLALPIAAWQARRLFVSRLYAFEVALAYTLSGSAMVSVLTILIADILDPPGLDYWIIGLCIGLVLMNVVMFVRNRVKGVSREATVEAFLLGGYFPAAVLALVAYGLDEIGSYVVLTACIAYLITIILLLTREAH